MMRILFTRSSSPLSRLIRSVTGEDVSHCAIQVDNYIIHSNLKGLHIESLEDFMGAPGVEIVHTIDLESDYQKILLLFCRYQHSMYDFGGLLYLGLRAMIPVLPKANLWQSTGMFLCTEWVTEYVESSPDSSITPYKLFLRLSKEQEGKR